MNDLDVDLAALDADFPRTMSAFKGSLYYPANAGTGASRLPNGFVRAHGASNRPLHTALAQGGGGGGGGGEGGEGGEMGPESGAPFSLSDFENEAVVNGFNGAFRVGDVDTLPGPAAGEAGRAGSPASTLDVIEAIFGTGPGLALPTSDSSAGGGTAWGGAFGTVFGTVFGAAEGATGGGGAGDGGRRGGPAGSDAASRAVVARRAAGLGGALTLRMSCGKGRLSFGYLLRGEGTSSGGGGGGGGVAGDGFDGARLSQGGAVGYGGGGGGIGKRALALTFTEGDGVEDDVFEVCGLMEHAVPSL
jgi:hypothetical protein